jgi:hypothetical protein
MLPLPVWPTDPNHQFFKNAARIYNKWMSLKVQPNIAWGFGVTQAEFESAFSITARGDKDKSVGIYQINVNRAAFIKEKTGIDLLTNPQIEIQCDAAWWELNNISLLGLELLLKTKTAADSAFIGCKYYERAGAADATIRRSLGAERWTVWGSKNAAFIASNPMQPHVSIFK